MNEPRAIEAWRSPLPALTLPLFRDATLAEAFQEVLARQAAGLARRREALLFEPDVETVHEARRDIARLRAALRLFDGALAGTDRRWFDHELSAWAKTLGEARDLDILLRRLTRRGARDGGLRAEDALRHAMAAAARDMTATRVAACARSARVIFLIDGLRAWAEEGHGLASWAEGSLALAVEGPRRLRLWRDRLPAPDARIDRLGTRDRHDLRKKLKTLRYSADLVRDILGEPVEERDVRLLAVLDILGELNDAEVCRRLSTRLFAPLEAGSHRRSADTESAKHRLGSLRDAWAAFMSAGASAAA